jgi:hypothetical protein
MGYKETKIKIDFDIFGSSVGVRSRYKKIYQIQDIIFERLMS